VKNYFSHFFVKKSDFLLRYQLKVGIIHAFFLNISWKILFLMGAGEIRFEDRKEALRAAPINKNRKNLVWWGQEFPGQIRSQLKRNYKWKSSSHPIMKK